MARVMLLIGTRKGLFSFSDRNRRRWTLKGPIFKGVQVNDVVHVADGGETSLPKNTNVHADFKPNRFPDVGVCMHHLEMHPSDGAGAVSTEPLRCLPVRERWRRVDRHFQRPASRFGFPLAVHPHDCETIYVCPAESDQHGFVSEAAFRVYRSRRRGKTWETLTSRLPQRVAHTLVLRQALTTDTLNPVGLYMGTSGGHLLASRN